MVMNESLYSDIWCEEQWFDFERLFSFCNCFFANGVGLLLFSLTYPPFSSSAHYQASEKRCLPSGVVMPVSFVKLGNSLPFSRLFRLLEQEMETVVRVLQPGPLGIIEHKFSGEEIRGVNATIRKAVENWQRNAKLEQQNKVLKDYIHE